MSIDSVPVVHLRNENQKKEINSNPLHRHYDDDDCNNFMSFVDLNIIYAKQIYDKCEYHDSPGTPSISIRMIYFQTTNREKKNWNGTKSVTKAKIAVHSNTFGYFFC